MMSNEAMAANNPIKALTQVCVAQPAQRGQSGHQEAQRRGEGLQEYQRRGQTLSEETRHVMDRRSSLLLFPWRKNQEQERLIIK